MEVMVSRWAFGPKVLENIQTLVTLTTVAMATKKLSQTSQNAQKAVEFYQEGHWLGMGA